MSVLDSTGWTVSETQSQCLLVMVVHYQSTNPIHFTSLKKGAILLESAVNQLLHKVPLHGVDQDSA